MKNSDSPIFYSFRRCPYAMRARLAIASAGIPVELREVVLRDKPDEMLQASPKGTVPVLVFPEGKVLEESIDIIDWALTRRDPEGLTDFSPEEVRAMRDLIEESDGPFKDALDRYKYPNRYAGIDPIDQREKGAQFIKHLDGLLGLNNYLFATDFSVADAAILPFVRQFAHVDREWFWNGNWKNVIRWLEEFLESDRFRGIMKKYPQWQSGQEGISFGTHQDG
ncbi:MAG: glutathione S-transferase [Pseudomonadota bacterium]